MHAGNTDGPVRAGLEGTTAERNFGLRTCGDWSVTEINVGGRAESLRATSAGNRAQDTERAANGGTSSGGLGPVSCRSPTPSGRIDEGGERTGARRGL